MISLSSHFTYGRLIRFAYPAMLTVLATSLYGVVDGVVVSVVVGKEAFAALNLIWPFVAILGSIGFMMGTGGSALVSKLLGEGHGDRARMVFSLITYFTIALSFVLGIAGLCVVRPVASLMGADGSMLNLCQEYGSILLVMLPAFALQVYFQSMLVTAERVKLGVVITLAAGLLNMALDVLFMYLLHWGLSGAAWATVLGQCLGGGLPLAYFFYRRRHRSLPLRLGRCQWHGAFIRKACSNGLSEFVIQISISMVSMLYMYQLMRCNGQDGVAAYGVMMYFAFTFCALYIGFGMSVTPIIGYHYGAQNHAEMRNVLKKSLVLALLLGVVVEALAQALARPLCSFFIHDNPHLLDYTTTAFRIYSIMFLYTGANIFVSAFFTGLNNGPISSLVSLMRTMGFEALCVFTIPAIFGIDSIWWSVDVAEGLTLFLAIWLLFHYRRKYNY